MAFDYKIAFDAAWTKWGTPGSKSYDNYSTGTQNPANPAAGYYILSHHVVPGTLSMFEATSDATYLVRVLDWFDLWIAKATITDSQGKKNWPGTWNKPEYSSSPIAGYNLEFVIAREMMRAAAIIHTDVTLTASYGTRAATIYNFARDHIMNKAFITRGYLGWQKSRLKRLNRFVHKYTMYAIAMMNDAKRSADAQGNSDATTYGWTADLSSMATDLRAHFYYPGNDTRCNNSSAQLEGTELIFDCGLWVDGSAPRVLEMNALIDCVVKLRESSTVFTAADLTGLANLFVNFIWDGSYTSPMFSDFIDGSLLPNGTRYTTAKHPSFKPRAWSKIHYGCALLASHDSTMALILDRVCNAMDSGVKNFSLDRNNNLWGIPGLNGHMKRAEFKLGSIPAVPAATSDIPSLTFTGTDFNPGASIVVTVSGGDVTRKGQWVGLFAANWPRTAAPMEWQFMDGTQTKPGSVTLPAVLTFTAPEAQKEVACEFWYFEDEGNDNLIAKSDHFRIAEVRGPSLPWNEGDSDWPSDRAHLARLFYDVSSAFAKASDEMEHTGQ